MNANARLGWLDEDWPCCMLAIYSAELASMVQGWIGIDLDATPVFGCDFATPFVLMIDIAGHVHESGSRVPELDITRFVSGIV